MATAAGANPASWAIELSVRAKRQKKFAPEEEEKWPVGGGRITLLC